MLAPDAIDAHLGLAEAGLDVAVLVLSATMLIVSYLVPHAHLSSTNPLR